MLNLSLLFISIVVPTFNVATINTHRLVRPECPSTPWSTQSTFVKHSVPQNVYNEANETRRVFALSCFNEAELGEEEV